MDVGAIVGIVGVVIAGVALFLTRTISRSASDAKIDGALTNGRVLALEKVMEMVIKNLTVSFVVEKHRPHPEFAAQDELIEKFANDSITRDEQAEFLMMIKADAEDVTGETATRLYAGAILELGHARDIIHVSSPAFTQLPKGEQMIETMRALNADTKDWLQVKIARDKAEADAGTGVEKPETPPTPPQLDRIESNTEDIKEQLGK